MESVEPVATQPDAVAEAERSGFSAYITIGIIVLNTLVFAVTGGASRAWRQ